MLLLLLPDLWLLLQDLPAVLLPLCPEVFILLPLCHCLPADVLLLFAGVVWLGFAAEAGAATLPAVLLLLLLLLPLLLPLLPAYCCSVLLPDFHASPLAVLFGTCAALLPASLDSPESFCADQLLLAAAGFAVLLPAFQPVELVALAPGTAAACAAAAAAGGLRPACMPLGSCSADDRKLQRAQHSITASHWPRHPAPGRWRLSPILC